MSCPYCNSPVLLNDVAGNPWYQCGTTKTFRSASCVDREPIATELRNALGRIKRLEEAGDALFELCDASPIQFELVDQIPQRLKAWEEAKEDKP